MKLLKKLSFLVIVLFIYGCPEEGGIVPVDPDPTPEIPEGCDIYEDPIGAFDSLNYFLTGISNKNPYKAIGGYFTYDINVDLPNGGHPFVIYFNDVDRCNRADLLFRIKVPAVLEKRKYDLLEEINNDCINQEGRIYAFNNLGVWGELAINQVYDSLLSSYENNLVITEISEEDNFVSGNLNLHLTKRYCNRPCWLDSCKLSQPVYEDFEPKDIHLTEVRFKLPYTL